MSNVRRSNARAFAGLMPFLLVGLALPLLAPTCGGFQPGVKTFAKGSLVIPMDVCYQCTRQSADGFDTATANCTKTGYVSPGGNQCGTPTQALAPGDVLKAYGLVYQLIRNDVPVYWVIDPGKTAVDAYDVAIQYNAGFPVAKLDWASGQAGAPPTAASVIRYMGGPFVVDGTDAAKALAVMRANAATFSAVNVHITSVAFQAPVAKTMAGGWSAGGAVPPKLALLNIASGNLSRHGTQAVCTSASDTSHACDSNYCLNDPKNAEPVIEGYLARAGIGSGTAGGSSAPGAHGQIYDRLGVDDFLPTAGGDWTTTNFYKNGYQVLWVPHWLAPGSCRAAAPNGSVSACACLATRITSAEVDSVLQTIGAFSKAGNDVFAECAGLGSFEGAFGGLTSTSYTVDYADGDPTTRFQTKTGVRYNVVPGSLFPSASLRPDGVGNFASPLMQIGDFPFRPYSGAIENFKPDDTAAADRNYQSNVIRLIGINYSSGSPSVSRDWDFFTLRPPDSAAATRHGTIVYLAGHSYSGVQGNYQAAGSRLVVNTLFNLGAACTASGVACDTGLLGVCSRGVLTCDANGQQVCTPSVLPGTRAEICNGLDDDCNGLVDENLEQGCYDGPAGTQNVGACRAGVRTCQQAGDGSYGYSTCHGEVVPTAEVCNGIDDDCNGTVDDGPGGGKLTEACYSGPPSTLGVGTCLAGQRTCDSGSWGVCSGEVTPLADPCSAAESGSVGADRNCDGALDSCGACTPATTRNCYDGPTGTDGVGQCHHGTQTCNALGQWGTSCDGQQVPQAEICNDGKDQGCHGDLRPIAGVTYTKPVGYDDDLNKGVIGSGHDGPPYCNTCGGPRWTAPSCWTGPATVASGATQVPTVFKAAGNSSVCAKGELQCVDGALGACLHQTLPGPELCNGKDDDCNGLVDDGATCGSDFACENGVCVYAACTPEVLCQAGYYCAAGHCKLSTCGNGTLVCPAGQACDAESGTCVDPCDPAKIKCGAGSTCAGGYCTGGACYATGCPADELCRAGSCVADACSGVICPSGTFCREGDCVQSCAFRSCGPSETCSADGFCVADPCAGKACGASQTCVAGTCQDDPCLVLACGAGQRCSGGTCLDDPCGGVTCPVGLCRDGQCYAVAKPSLFVGAGTTTKTGCGCGSGEGSPLAFLALLLMLPLARRRAGGRGRAALGLALLALAAGAVGCKKTTTFDPVACTALSAPLATCEGENRCVDLKTDPGHCGVCGRICEAGNTCVDGICGPSSAVAPLVTAVEPASAGTGGLAKVTVKLTGERFAAGATVRATSQGGSTSLTTLATVIDPGQLTADLDLSSAPPGTWTLRVVNPNLVVSNGKSFGVVIPTPAISRVIPSPDATPSGDATPAVATGGARTLLLQGSGLMLTSGCRISGSGVAQLGLAAELSSAGLTCQLDAASLPPGRYEIWVVNDADHLSPRAAFQIVSAPPVLTSLAPSGVRYNSAPPPVLLFGSGFDVSSRAWLGGTGLTEAALPTTLVDSTRLIASALDLQHCPSGPCPTSDATHRYWLEVRNGALRSAQVDLVIDSQTRAVSTLSPASAWQGDQPALTISGTGLTGGVLEVRPPGGAFGDSTSPQSAADGTWVSGVANLIGSPPGTAPAGSWDVRLRFPSGATSASFALRVDSNQAVITATPVPAGGRAGENVAVSLAVSNLRPPAAGVRVLVADPAPGATFSQSITPSAVPAGTSGTVTAVLPLLGLHTGVYAVSLVNPNGAVASAPYSFTVLPGTPRVDAVACTSVKPPGTAICETANIVKQQAALVPLRITGANFAQPDSAGNNGSQVLVSLPALGIVDQVVPQASVTVTSATQIDVALDTTSAIPSATASYSVKVRNPGGAPVSNELLDAFQIQP